MRNVVTLTAGTVGHPQRAFAAFAAISAAISATFGTLLGIALAITMIVETARALRRRQA